MWKTMNLGIGIEKSNSSVNMNITWYGLFLVFPWFNGHKFSHDHIKSGHWTEFEASNLDDSKGYQIWLIIRRLSRNVFFMPSEATCFGCFKPNVEQQRSTFTCHDSHYFADDSQVSRLTQIATVIPSACGISIGFVAAQWVVFVAINGTTGDENENMLSTLRYMFFVLGFKSSRVFWILVSLQLFHPQQRIARWFW